MLSIPAPNEGPLGLLLYGGSGTTGFVIFMVISVVIAIAASALVTIGTSGRMFQDQEEHLEQLTSAFYNSLTHYEN